MSGWQSTAVVALIGAVDAVFKTVTELGLVNAHSEVALKLVVTTLAVLLVVIRRLYSERQHSDVSSQDRT